MKSPSTRRPSWLRQAITGNWGLKLLSLILAVVLYYSIKKPATPHHGASDSNERKLFQYR